MKSKSTKYRDALEKAAMAIRMKNAVRGNVEPVDLEQGMPMGEAGTDAMRQEAVAMRKKGALAAKVTDPNLPKNQDERMAKMRAEMMSRKRR